MGKEPFVLNAWKKLGGKVYPVYPQKKHETTRAGLDHFLGAPFSWFGPPQKDSNGWGQRGESVDLSLHSGSSPPTGAEHLGELRRERLVFEEDLQLEMMMDPRKGEVLWVVSGATQVCSI